MVGSSNDYAINGFAHFIVHFAVIPYFFAFGNSSNTPLAYFQSTSQRATMFSVPFTLLMLACPHTADTYGCEVQLSVGETCPWLIPKIELGAMVIPAKAAAPVLRNFLLEKSDMVFIFKS